MVLKIFLLLFFLFYSVLIGNTIKISFFYNWQEDPCPVLWNRPDHTSLVPSTRIEFGSHTYTGSRHHVIPFELLRTFFTSALQLSRESSRIGGYFLGRISTIADQFIANGGSIQRQNPIEVDEAIIEVEPTEEMFAALTWLPGNIFIGPEPRIRHPDDPNNQRGGDPGNAFEQYANRIIRDHEHFTALENLNRDIQRYILNTLNVDLFDQIMYNFDIVNRITEPFPFDAQDWIYVNGKFYIREDERHRKKRFENQIPQPPLAPNSEPSSDDDPFDYYVGFCSAVKQRLTDSNISVNKKSNLRYVYLTVADEMGFNCPHNTYIIVKAATIKTMPWPLYIFSLGLTCLTGGCTNQDGTEKMKSVCDNKRSCVFSADETEGLDVSIDYYCSDILTSIQKRKTLQKSFRWGSGEFEINCPMNYKIRVDKAVRHSSNFFACIIDDCAEKDMTQVFREKCDGENPCKKYLNNWGLQPIDVDFSCIPILSMFM